MYNYYKFIVYDQLHNPIIIFFTFYLKKKLFRTFSVHQQVRKFALLAFLLFRTKKRMQ